MKDLEFKTIEEAKEYITKNNVKFRRFKIDGKLYRVRRGELVIIPEEWAGQVTYEQTIRKRPSKKGQGKTFKSKAVR